MEDNRVPLKHMDDKNGNEGRCLGARDSASVNGGAAASSVRLATGEDDVDDEEEVAVFFRACPKYCKLCVSRIYRGLCAIGTEPVKENCCKWIRRVVVLEVVVEELRVVVSVPSAMARQIDPISPVQ